MAKFDRKAIGKATFKRPERKQHLRLVPATGLVKPAETISAPTKDSKIAQTGGSFYKTYHFVDKDPVIYEVEAAYKASGMTLSQIEQESGVRAQTLVNWFYRLTKRPSNASVRAVMKALGYSHSWIKD